MSRSKWIAAAALFALAVPAVQAGDRTRVQITVAPYWVGPVYGAPPWRHRHGGYAGYRDSRYGGYYGGYYGRPYGRPYGGLHGAPVIRFEYRDHDRRYGSRGPRLGGHLRYDSRRDRDYYRGRDGWRDGRRDRDWDRRGGDRRWRD
jgi:hypothetical protein